MKIPAEQSDDEDSVGLEELLAPLWARRWWITASFFIFTTSFGLAAFLTTPVYRATTVLVSAHADRAGLSSTLSSALGPLGDLASLAGVNMGISSAASDEALAVLNSRQFTESFINDNNLMPELFPNEWDVTTGKWKVSSDKQPTSARAYKYFDTKIRSVVDDKKTGLVFLRIDWKDRAKAAAWANDLVQRLNAEMRARAIAQTDASLGYLQKELAATSVVDAREAINRLVEAQINQRMLANVTKEYVFRVVDRAMAPDRDDVVKPKKLVLIAVGMFLGLTVGGAAALLFRRKDERP